MKSLQNLLLLLVLPLCGFSQTGVIDSLKKNVFRANSAGEKIGAIFALCEQGYSLNPDTMKRYTDMGEALALKQGNGDNNLRMQYYRTMYLVQKGELDSALELADNCLAKLNGTIKDPVLEAELINQKGRCYVRKNQYSDAIAMGYKTVSFGEKYNDTVLQVKGKTLIGWAYMEMGQLQEALHWHLNALHTTTDTTLFNNYPALYANLCTNYTNLGNLDSAFYFADKAISISRTYGNLLTLSNALAMRSELYEKTGHTSLAGADLEEGVNIRKSIGDPFYIASDLSQLGYFYAHNGMPLKGIAACNEGIAIAKKYNLGTKLIFLYVNLAANYKASGNIEKYAETLEHIIDIKDSVYQKNSADAVAEMGTKYDLQKKENLIIQQKLNIRDKDYLFYGSLLVLVFACIFAWMLFRGYRRRQKIKLLQMQEEEKIRSAVAVTKAEEDERKRIAADLHDNLGAYAAAIAGNVDRLVADQNKETPVQELKINSQSIVSELNDTIWVLKKDNLSLTAISDRVKVFIHQISGSYPQVNIDVTEHINTDILLPPAQAFNLYRIAKEAVGNALKHSGAKNIRVCFESSESWKLVITDDGKGMSVTDKFSNGNGLTNIKKRSRESGWSASWQSNETGGTDLVITPTTN